MSQHRNSSRRFGGAPLGHCTGSGRHPESADAPNPGPRRRWRGRKITAALAVATVAGGLLAGCGSSAGSSSSTKTPTLGVILPFTGSQASLGQIAYPPCPAAVSLINAAGGVLGHHVTCAQIDDVGDAADAVPNVTKAIATNSSLVGVLGVDSNVAGTVVPILDHAKLPSVEQNGSNALNTNRYQYYWRNSAPDLAGGLATGLWAAQRGYKHVAVITQNDVSDTGLLAGTVKALASAHVQVASNVTIPGDAASYQSVVTRVAASHPDALVISTDEPTLGTLLAEYKTLSGGAVPPVISNTAILDTKSFSIIKASTNLQYVLNKVSFVGGYLDQTTPQFKAYRDAMVATSHGKFPIAAISNGIVAAFFDGANILALAMDKAHSTATTKYSQQILNVTRQRPGAVVVHTYAQGASEIKAGHEIQYVGVTGPIAFDQYHNSPGEFAGIGFTASAGSRTLGVVSQSAVASLTH